MTPAQAPALSPTAARGCAVTEARQVLDAAMTEDELLEAVVEMAERLGWRVSHIPDKLYKLAAEEQRWDAMRGAKSFPDLVMVRNGWLIFAELKTEDGELEAGQVEWKRALQYVEAFTEEREYGPSRVRWCLWRPHHHSDGTIEAVLRG